MEYKRYPKYRDSNVEWLSEIPKHWDESIISALFEDNKHKNKDSIEQNLLSLSYGRIINKDINTEEGLLPASFETYQIVEPDYIVLRLTDLQNDQRSLRVGHVRDRGIITSAYTALKKKSFRMASARYFYYLLHAYDLMKVFYGMGAGVRQSLSYDELKKIRLILPAEDEQKSIVRFLDRETTRIDGLIEKKQRLIELLKEKRQAVITQAVTKGLDPNVPMKDSGVEWLGEVPKHWNVAKLKRVTGLVGGYAFSSDDFEPEGIQLLRIGNVYQNKLSLERQPVYMPVEFLDLYKRFAVYKGDLLVSMTGTIGKRDYGFAVKTSEDGPFLLNQRVGKFLINDEKITTDYLEAVLHSDHYLNQLYSLPFGTKQANLSNDDILSIEMGFPPTLTEQVKICDYILENTVRIDNIIAKSDESIDLLIEHRSALITAAVTGQIDVRNVA